ncbi:MAG: cation acetate symporter [Pseudomonadota bacterium]
MNRLLIGVTLAFFLGLSTLGACPDEAPAWSLPAEQGTGVASGSAPASSGSSDSRSAVPIQGNRTVSVTVFVIIIAITLLIVYVTAKQTKTSADFYVARSSLTGVQNGWALAGDYMSAASFLGIAGLISLYGYDGFMYSVGWLVTYMTMLFLVAEPCRNVGRFTMGDILAVRSFPIPVRAMGALSTVLVSVFYLLAQMVGAGKLMELLLGIPYSYSVVGVGALMIIYVAFGGMLATTWVQIIKAGMILAGAVVVSLLVVAKAGYNPIRIFTDVAENFEIQEWVRIHLLKHPSPMEGYDYGRRFLEPGLFLKNPLDQISLGLALVLGTAGMPHILMRFFTVPTAQAARKSVIVAMFIIGIFYILTAFMGFGAALHVGPTAIFRADEGGNTATVLLAQKLGFDIAPIFGDFLFAFLCAVAFATILAVVSGLVLAASAAIAHDVYVSLIKRGRASRLEQITAARLASFAVGIIAILIGLAAEGQNVAQLVALAFAVAASANLPVVLLSLFWRRFNTAGIVAGLFVGATASIVLVLLSPNMTYPRAVALEAKEVIDVLEQKQSAGRVQLSQKELASLAAARSDYEKNKDGNSVVGLDKPLFPLKNPGIVSIPLAFLAAVVVALAFPGSGEEERFDELLVRRVTGEFTPRPPDE